MDPLSSGDRIGLLSAVRFLRSGQWLWLCQCGRYVAHFRKAVLKRRTEPGCPVCRPSPNGHNPPTYSEDQANAAFPEDFHTARSGRLCPRCYDLPHRRLKPSCPNCKAPHAPEQ